MILAFFSFWIKWIWLIKGLCGVILLHSNSLGALGRFSLCHTSIRPISTFQDHISILIVGCITTRSRGWHQLVLELGFETRSLCYFHFFTVLLSFSVSALFIVLFLMSATSKKKGGLYYILLLSLIISTTYKKIKRERERERN
jgi:asparagine N-glycosylation enzyme membrane subunit Stt3